MPGESSVLVVIPTYQEAANIDLVLSAIRTSEPSANVLVVDDNSPDGTAGIAEKTAKRLGMIQVLRRPGKSGLGSAYREGFAWGLRNGFDVMVEMDADLSHDPAALPSLLKALDDGADLVVGSRYVPGGAIPGWPAHRALLSRYGNRYATAALGLGIRDATSGYRAYKAEILRRFPLHKVKADGYGFQIEMVHLVKRAGGVIKEVPITFVDRVDGVSKMSTPIIIEAMVLVTFWGLRYRLLQAVGRPFLRLLGKA